MKEKTKSTKTDDMRRQREEEHLRREAERKRKKFVPTVVSVEELPPALRTPAPKKKAK